ncbi:hypothetical protein V6615_01025 [Oscillospiraceae bacterium PP1C4]
MEWEAQAYIDGKAVLPDEALDLVSGGGDCSTQSICPVCQQPLTYGGIYTSLTAITPIAPGTA